METKTRVHVGTSGYQYPDWAGAFYPEGTPKTRMLDHYVQHFDTVELNSSYYGVPRLSTTERLAHQTPASFLTVVKAYKGMTHKFEGWDVYDQFHKSLAPLRDAGKLAGVLFQFPPWFSNDLKRHDYLRRLPELIPDTRLIVEFRSHEWMHEKTFELLESIGLGYSCVDEPDLPELLPRIARVTSPVGYLRFHSRNAAKWYAKGHGRYDYDYSDEELGEWIGKIAPLLPRVERFLVYFNNCERGSAPRNALRFRDLFEALLEKNEGPP